MSIMKLGRFAALESDVPDSPVLGADDLDESGAPVDASNTVEAAAIDAAEVEQPVIEETNEELETLDDSAESLEAYLDFIKEAKQNGGMDKNTAKAVKIGLDNALRPLGTNSADFLGMSKASLESFNTSRRLNQTVSLENSITEALKSVWEAIKRGINKLITYVRDWWLKNFDVAIRIKKRAEKIKSKANETNGAAKEKKIDVPNIKQLHISKKAPTTAQITSSIEDVRKLFEGSVKDRVADSYRDVADGCVEMVDKIEAIFNVSNEQQSGGKPTANVNSGQTQVPVASEAAKPVQDVVDAVDATADAQGNVAANADADTPQVPDHATRFSNLGEDSSKVEMGTQLCGGKAIFVYADHVATEMERIKPADGKEVTIALIQAVEKTVTKAFCYIDDFSSKKVEVDSSVSGDTLKPSEVESICSEVISAMEEVSRYKQNYSKYERYTKDAIKKMDSSINKANKDSSSDAGKAGRSMAKIMAAGIKGQTRTINSSMGYLITTSRAALGYCTSSLAQYKD